MIAGPALEGARAASQITPPGLSIDDLVWAMGSLCALNQKPFDAELLARAYPPPYEIGSFEQAATGLGFRVKRLSVSAREAAGLTLPCLVFLSRRIGDDVTRTLGPALLVQVDGDKATLFDSGSNLPRTLSSDEFAREFTGVAILVGRGDDPVEHVDGPTAAPRRFGFRWFVPELLRHRAIWRDVLIASFVLQLLALGTPLFTQLVIDKVVVHHSQSTLIVVAVGLGIFMLFNACLSWVRQYLILHTGNRVDAVLGQAVFKHLVELPQRFFEHRPTGVITSRLQGIETIREFIAGAAVTLVLDLPFLLIFIAIMFYYSVQLTAITLAIISLIVLLSWFVAPVFRAQLNNQFQLGARNQAFLTEYIAGMETVKSLQMEPQLTKRYGDYLAAYLRAGFATKLTANTYNSVANALEQVMTLLILVVGAYTVMEDSAFSIGMLIAFQMFAGRVSQPMLRLVGLWQQFQQANMSVARLGDVMNAPTEPYSSVPRRIVQRRGELRIVGLGFRYSENLPFLYDGFSMEVRPGEVIALMGASGSGKSTLTKLLQGFAIASSGTIFVDGQDSRSLSANELRQYFGVVPQETILFSGTIFDNVLMGNPNATFDDVVEACRMADINESIEKLPMGYQTVIGERGVGLSGGQKQRIAIARALLKRPAILLFDEATSGLDEHTANHIAATVNALRSRMTIVFIAHLLPSSLQVDRVVRLE